MPWVINSHLPGAAEPGRGYHAPKEMAVEYSPENDEPAVTVLFEVTNEGTLRCKRVCVEATDSGREVRRSDLDQPLEDMADEALTSSLTWVSEPENGWVNIHILPRTDLTAVRKHVAAARTPARRRVITDDLLREVAEVYRAALGDGRHPTEAVRTYTGKSHRTASDYIERSRERGFLGPAPGRGKAGEKPS